MQIEQRCRNTLIRIASGYAKANGVTLAAVSRKIYGNVDFFENWAAGRCTVTMKKYDEMVSWFEWQSARKPTVKKHKKP